MSKLEVPDFTPEHVITVDAETFYDADYTLKKLSTSDYVRDDRFSVVGVGVNDGDETVWMEEWEFRNWAATVPWDRVLLIAHHSQFDGLILSHHYGIFPAAIACTMSMARTFGLEEGVSLEALGSHFGTGQKGDEVINAKGKRREDFTREEWLKYGEYCKTDVAICKGSFEKMVEQGFPEPELWLVDSTAKMFTDPQFVLDEPQMREYLQYEQERKAALLERVGMDRKAVGSNEVLAQAFRTLGVEAPTKVSPKTGKTIYAFAKSDPGMQELLEHQDDDVRWLAEARIGVKSTINETRTERFLKLGANGATLPVYLKYAGAHTWRWSGGDRRNFQNLGRVDKRKPMSGKLKKSVLAPRGYHVVAADSGAIEARVNAWMAGHVSLVDALRMNQDIYSQFASEVYGRKVDRKRGAEHPEFNPEDESAGGLGKVACFAAGTLVLTQRGWVQIVEVEITDRLWDGVEWVEHQGVKDQGIREVWESSSVSATPDHEILTGHGWRKWSEVLTSPSLFQSGLSSVHLPSSGGNSTRTPAVGPQDGVRSFSALVDGRVELTVQTSSVARPPGATPARRSKQTRSGTGSTATRCPTTTIVAGFSTGGHPASPGVITLGPSGSATTGGEEYLSATSGVPTPPRFFGTSLRSRGGTSLSLSSTEPTTTEDTSPGTSGSSLARSTPETSDRSERCRPGFKVSKRRTRVYDLLSAGPRSRFTILSGGGPLIVHNCLALGYQMGWPKFATALLAGPMGAAPIQLVEKDLVSVGADFNRFVDDDWKMDKVEGIVSRLSEEALLVHCATAEKIVSTWRKVNSPIVDLWKTMSQVIETMDEAGPGEEYVFGPGDCLKIVRHGIVLPNGLMLRYPGLRPSEDGGYSYLGQYGKQRKHIYGGLLDENVIQALARIIVGEQMLSIKAKYGYDTKLCTHDEICIIVPEAEAELATRRLVEEMKIAPAWAAGLPLTAEGGHAKSYGDC